jgi:hypothetical protein
MKARLIAVAALCLASPVTAEPTDTNKVAATEDQLGEKLAQAIMLARVGLYDEAETLCKQILAQKPDQPTVKQLLREIDEQRHRLHAQDPGYDLKQKLRQTIVPEVSVRNASPADVIEILRRESKSLTPDSSEINFVWQVSPEAKLPPVTLNLRKIPMLDVVEYVTQIAALRYRVDAHAVVIYQPQPEKPVPPATEPNVKPQ